MKCFAMTFACYRFVIVANILLHAQTTRVFVDKFLFQTRAAGARMLNIHLNVYFYLFYICISMFVLPSMCCGLGIQLFAEVQS